MLRLVKFAQRSSCHFYTCAYLNAPVTKQFNLTDIGEGIREVVVKEWFVSEGDTVSQFDQVCEVQSDKASVTITSRYDGTIKRLHYPIDAVALVGKPLVDIEVEDDDTPDDEDSVVVEKRTALNSAAGGASGTGDNLKVLATPAVRRFAAEHGVDIKNLVGSAKDGRILKEDILKFKESQTSSAKEVLTSPALGAPKSPTFSAGIPAKPAAPKKIIESIGKDERVQLTTFQKAMVKSMTEALKIPHFGLSDEVDVSELVRLKSQFQSVAAAYNIKLTYMPFLIKAASLALTQYPSINALYDGGSHVEIKANHNISVAMDTPNGLTVPVIKYVNQMSILQVAEELMRLQALGVNGKLSQDDLTGSTFSLSNIGFLGGTYTSPVIPPPTVVIGALGRIQRVPRFTSPDSSNVKEVHLMNISWSADHRVLDGVTVCRFSNYWKSLLEDPVKMILHMK